MKMWKLGNPEISHLLNPTLTSPNLIPGKGGKSLDFWIPRFPGFRPTAAKHSSSKLQKNLIFERKKPEKLS